MMSSFWMNLRPSAIGCRSPKGPTRFGPRRYWMIAESLRSTHVMIETHSINRLKTLTILRKSIRMSTAEAPSNPCGCGHRHAEKSHRLDGDPLELLDALPQSAEDVVRAGPRRDRSAGGGGDVDRDAPSGPGFAQGEMAAAHALGAAFEVHVRSVGLGTRCGRAGDGR